MQKNLLECVQKTIGKLYDATDRTIQEMLTRRIRELEDYTKSYGPTDELLYGLGLCLYHMPDGVETRESHAKTYFKKTLELNPEHYFARLYLGHLFFDMRQFSRAEACFSQLPNGVFSRQSQAWRDLKVAELRLAARLQTNPGAIWKCEFEALADCFEKEEEEDRPLPTELVSTVVEIMQKNASSVKDFQVPFLRLLDTVDGRRVFKEELKMLRAEMSRS